MDFEYSKIIKLIDSINAYKLIEFIKKNGYPSEFNCGIDSTQYLPFNNIPSQILIMHQAFGGPTRVINFSPYLLDALKKEEVLPHIGLAEYTIANGRDLLFGKGCFFELEQENGEFKYAYYPKYLKGKEEEFNLNRQVYNLESLDDYRKKVIYWLKNKDLVFDFIMGEDVQKFPKAIAKFLKDVKYID